MTGYPSASPGLEILQKNRQRVAEIRERARRLFQQSATGVQVTAAISEGMDEFVRGLYRIACGELQPSDRQRLASAGALIAVGGTGRGDLCPYSDIDLLFLYGDSEKKTFGEVAGRVVRDSWDAGLQLGHAIRNSADTIALARQDAQVATGLVEARLLDGSQQLFDQFRKRAAKAVFKSRLAAFLQMCVDARDEERRQHGSTVQQLEPDVKKSLGGLRDIHLLRWIAYAHYDTGDIESLRLRGVLEKEEARTLQAALEFLLRIRVDLHYAADKSQDILSRDEQRRITEQRRIEPVPGMRPVERFMRDYFRHTTGIASVVQRFLVTHQQPSLGRRVVRSLMMHRADGLFRVGGDVIDVIPRYRSLVLSRLEPILRLFCAQALSGIRIEPKLIADIKAAAPSLPNEISDESRTLFFRIMGSVGHLGATLRSLFETGVLDILVPAVTHVRCLLQFNQYHSFTVDEHTLRAIEAIEKFDKDEGTLGKAYRQIRHKQILHLALLLHDLGKGFEDDHSEVGRVIAQQTGERLRLLPAERETLAFLVHRHLRMSTIAFRRDLDDPEVVLQFAREVGSPETLRMLYALTAADITAVGPGVWTNWKADLLADLYERAMQVVSGERHPREAGDQRNRITDELKTAVGTLMAESVDTGLRERLKALVDQMPKHYLAAVSPERILADLQAINGLKAGDVVIESRYDEETRAVDYRVIADPSVAEGCFHKISGVLTAKRMEILSAQICTSTAGVVVDAFRVLDRDYLGEVPQDRQNDVGDSIRSVLEGRMDVKAMFQRHRRYGTAKRTEPFSDLPIRVVVDNETSDRATIIDVFAFDRTGLLYTVTRALYELGLSVTLAKISTYFDQVVDVFYVTESSGQRLRDPARLRAVRDQLTERIEHFDREGWQQFVN